MKQRPTQYVWCFGLMIIAFVYIYMRMLFCSDVFGLQDFPFSFSVNNWDPNETDAPFGSCRLWGKENKEKKIRFKILDLEGKKIFSHSSSILSLFWDKEWRIWGCISFGIFFMIFYFSLYFSLQTKRELRLPLFLSYITKHNCLCAFYRRFIKYIVFIHFI